MRLNLEHPEGTEGNPQTPGLPWKCGDGGKHYSAEHTPHLGKCWLEDTSDQRVAALEKLSAFCTAQPLSRGEAAEPSEERIC